MSTGYRIVPLEPTREMLVAANKVNGICPIYAAMIAAAPVPPAGGAQEIRTIVTESLLGMISAVVSATPPADEPLPDFIQSPIDRAVTRISAHATQLQAERDQYCRMYDSASGALCAIGAALGVDEDDQSTEASMEAIARLQADVQALTQTNVTAMASIEGQHQDTLFRLKQIEALQSELAKAGELLQRAEPWLRRLNEKSDNNIPAFVDIAAYLDLQSASATEGFAQ